MDKEMILIGAGKVRALAEAIDTQAERIVPSTIEDNESLDLLQNLIMVLKDEALKLYKHAQESAPKGH